MISCSPGIAATTHLGSFDAIYLGVNRLVAPNWFTTEQRLRVIKQAQIFYHLLAFQH